MNYVIIIASIISISIAIQPIQLNGQFVEDYRRKVENQLTVQFNYTNPGEYYGKQTSPIYAHIRVQVIEDSDTELTLRIENDLDQFEIPHEFPFPYNKESPSTPTYSYTVNEGGSFFKLKRDNGNTVINIKEAAVLSLLYSELRANVESEKMWGFGERRLHQFNIPDGEYTIWSHDFMFFDEQQKGYSQYGAQPVMLQNINDLYHMMLIRTSRPMAVEKNNSELIFRITGGILEFKFFVGGDSPKEVIRKYHRYVNGWTLHPFWASGWHQCRWGYENSTVLKEVISKYAENQLPLEVIWSDLDYMLDKKDFTLDESLYPRKDIQEISDRTKQEGLHWVPIIDPGIAIDSDCGRDLVQYNAYMTSNKQNETPFIGVVWPGDVYFPDFNHYNASELWHKCQMDWQKNYGILPSGIWIDMNELANFVDGEKAQKKRLNPDVVVLEDLPWDANGDINLEAHGVAIDALHSGNGRYFKGYEFVQELDFHNFNGFLESIATKESQEKIHGTSLNFILTRSQTFGSGRFVQHWFGDNASTWEWLRTSIASMWLYNIFGIPFVGDDICGFQEESNAQLCARWMQLGVFYPFSRNHNILGAAPQEPYVFDEYVTESSRKSITLKYKFLKYYYTQFVIKRDRELGAGAGTIVDPLFFHYDDEKSFSIEDQFMIGDLIVIPIVTEQTDPTLKYTEREYHVPKNAVWYSLESGKKLSSGILRREFSDTAFLGLNQGSVIPISNSEGVMRLRYLPTEISLIVVLDQQGQASGYYLSILSYDEQNVEKRCWSGNNSCVRRVDVKLNKGVLVFTNGVAEDDKIDKSEDIRIEQIVLYYLQSIKIINVNVSSLTKQWQINL